MASSSISNERAGSLYFPVSRVEDPHSPENRAATIIQKHFRGHLARKAHLPQSLFPQYQIQCLKAKGPESHFMLKAKGGKTTVLLPQEVPEIVLKCSGRKDAIKRFHQMQEVRSVLKSQKSSHLIIPRANLCQELLVEQRLPINVDAFHNMWIYLSQPELFDEAVRELTRLFSRMYLSDLVDYQYHPLGHIADVKDFVRYDNLPLYISEENGRKEGYIGLIDLEHTLNHSSPDGLQTLVRIFPLHLDVIKAEASKLNMVVNEDELGIWAEKGQKFLKVGFMDHLEWLKLKNVSSQSFWQPLQVSVERREELKVIIENELLKLNQGMNDSFKRRGYQDQPQKNFFSEHPEEIANELAEAIVPLIISNLAAQIEKNLNKQLSEIQQGDLTEAQIVGLRSPVLKRPKLYAGVTALIGRNQKIQFEQNGFAEKRDIAEQLLYVFMENLVKSGEIFYFDPAYYSGGHDLCWIRY